MKATEEMLERIDLLNQQMKKEKDMPGKMMCMEEIVQTIHIIKELSNLERDSVITLINQQSSQ